MIETFILPVIEKLFGKFVGERTLNKKYYEIVWKNSTKLEPKDLLGLRGEEEYGFNEYYKMRQQDHAINGAIKRSEDLLVVGNPLAGKTRAVYNGLINLEVPVDVIVPRVIDIEFGEFRIPKKIHPTRRGVVILDDVQKFVEKRNFIHLMREFHDKEIQIIVTCRSGKPFDSFRSQLENDNYPPFKNVVEIPKPEKSFCEEVAEETVGELPSTFDGNIGSIFLPLETMKTRFRESTPEEKGILKSIEKLYRTGIYEGREQFSIERIKRVCEESKGIRRKKYEWDELFERLEKNGFFEIYQNVVEIEETYLTDVIDERVSLDDFHEMLKIFTGDPEALYRLGYRANEIGEVDLDKAEFMKIAIEAYKGALVVWTRKSNPEKYGWAKNNLGIAYARLSDVEDPKENVKRAIDAFNNAIKVRTIKKYPEDFATTKMNLGNAYTTLSEVEDNSENCKKAIEAYEEALNIYSLNRFPMDYAMTQMNLGGAYGRLSEVEDKAKNVKRAIEAYEEALKVRTTDRFQMQHTATQVGLGAAYTSLSEVENKAENAKLAIAAFEEVLKIFTIDRFPMQYAMTKMNLGNAYGVLSDVEDKTEKSKKAIETYNETLNIYTLDRFPIQYATTQMNLGVTYLKLSKVEDKEKNAKLAIVAYKEALKIYTLDRFPMQYADTHINLGNAYIMLSDVMDSIENLKKSLNAYEEASKVYTKDKFSIQFEGIMRNVSIALRMLKELGVEIKEK